MRRRLAVAAGCAALIAPAVTIPAVAAHSGGRSHTAALTASQPAVRAYYQAAKSSLSPLIVHVRDIPGSLARLAGGTGTPEPAVAAAADGWAQDCATARDLVGRLRPLPGPVGAHVARLYQTAAMLQAEAARTAATAAGESAGAQVADARLGQHLYSLGDRLFDSAYRLLNSRGAMAAMEMRFPSAVPDFTGTPAKTSVQPAPSSASRWSAGNHQPLGTLARLAHAPELDVSAISTSQQTLDPTVTEPVAQEAVNDLRLAAVVWSQVGPDNQAARRVRLIGDRLWSGALDLLSADGADVTGLALPIGPEQTLFTGGVFDGHPPALRPGDQPGKDVPGGLPSLDSPALLGN
jgi:hypothetical protein